VIRLATLLEITGLKALDRAGWVRVGVPAPESVAAHSWGVGWLVLALAPPELDRGRCLAYATLHDLAEVRVGDLTPADVVPVVEKHRREAAALADLLAARPDLLALADAYEAGANPEARFVRQLDRLDMALQALAYHRAGNAGMAEFVHSAAAVVDHPALRPLLEEILTAVATAPGSPGTNRTAR
jgi:putative hydrolase of HD superfamily